MNDGFPITRLKTQIIILFCSLVPLLLFPSLINAQVKAYRIGPNDVLTITIHAGGEIQHTSPLTVSAHGTIDAPFIGAVKAEGLTPAELERQITDPLAKDYFVNPKVSIQIKEYRSLNYYITGAIKSPGLYSMETEATLLVLISQAGGILPGHRNLALIMRDSADAVMSGEKVETLASKTEPLKVDLQRLIDQGDTSINPLLKPGDVVYIPLKESLNLTEKKIYLDGEIRKPGAYDYQPGMTAFNACTMAGGFGQYAAPNRTRIIRKKGDDIEVIRINLNHVKEGKIPDIELKPGDRVHIPETWL